MFDFNKLDKYKTALEDGFVHTEYEDDGNGFFSEHILSFIPVKEIFSYHTFTDEEIIIHAEDKDFEKFKEKLSNYILNPQEEK